MDNKKWVKWWEMPLVNRRPVRQYITLVVMLFLFWLVLSGNFTPKHLLYGIITSVISAWICMPLLMVPEDEKRERRYFLFDLSYGKLILYYIWLIKELIKANIDVAKAELSPNLNISPRIVRFRYFAKNPIAKALLANSITLTPGTVTLFVSHEGVYEVHALTENLAKGLEEGEMQRRVAALFKEDGSIEVLGEDA